MSNSMPEMGSCISLICKADIRYEGLLFTVPIALASDIEYIRIVNNNPVPNDPVIMQIHLPPQQSLSPMQSKFSQLGFMMPPIGPGGPGLMGGPPPGNQPIGQPYSSFGGLNNLEESVLDLVLELEEVPVPVRLADPAPRQRAICCVARAQTTVDMGV